MSSLKIVRGGVFLLIALVFLSASPTALASHRSEDESPVCTCRASLKFAKPELSFKGGVLHFVPRVDVSIRTRGEATAPDWQIGLTHEGEANFSSEDVTAPGAVGFSGEQVVAGGQCGRNRYSFEGLSLGEVPFSQLLASLVGNNQELEGVVGMQASLTGCDQDEEHRSFKFRLRDLGNLKVYSWRSVR